MHLAALNHPILGALFGGWEVVLLLAFILTLFGAQRFFGLRNGLHQGLDEFKRALDEVTAEMRHVLRQSDNARQSTSMDNFLLWLARGFDIGRIPIAPGTFGSLLGLLWVAVLLVPGSLTFYLIGTLFGIGLSIWACGEAERILGETDPGSVVLDEIAALPVCFLPWIGLEYFQTRMLPSLETFNARSLYLTAAIFILFRIFDIWKPWPVRQSQTLPGGWGVTVDDLLAAVYVGLVSLFFLL